MGWKNAASFLGVPSGLPEGVPVGHRALRKRSLSICMKGHFPSAIRTPVSIVSPQKH